MGFLPSSSANDLHFGCCARILMAPKAAKSAPKAPPKMTKSVATWLIITVTLMYESIWTIITCIDTYMNMHLHEHLDLNDWICMAPVGNKHMLIVHSGNKTHAVNSTCVLVRLSVKLWTLIPFWYCYRLQNLLPFWYTIIGCELCFRLGTIIGCELWSPTQTTCCHPTWPAKAPVPPASNSSSSNLQFDEAAEMMDIKKRLGQWNQACIHTKVFPHCPTNKAMTCCWVLEFMGHQIWFKILMVLKEFHKFKCYWSLTTLA